MRKGIDSNYIFFMFRSIWGWLGYNQPDSNENESNKELSADEIREARLARFAGGNNSKKDISPPDASEDDVDIENENKDDDINDQDIEKNEEEEEEVEPMEEEHEIKEETSQQEQIIEEIEIKEEKEEEIKEIEKKDTPKTPEIDKNENEPEKTLSSSLRSSGNIEKWEDRIIREIFNVTLYPEKHSSTIYYLYNVAKKLEESSCYTLSIAQIDQILEEQLKNNSKTSENPLNYIMKCLNNLQREIRKTRTSNNKQEKFKTIEKILMNHIVLIVTNSSDYKVKIDPAKELLDCIINGNISSKYLSEIIDILIESKQICVFTKIFSFLMEEIKKTSLDDNFSTKLIGVFCELLNNVHIATVIISDDHWLASPNSTGIQIEQQTYLGVLLSLGCIPTKSSSAIASKYFINSSSMSPSSIEGIRKSFRIKLNSNVNVIHHSLMSLIKNLKEPGKEAWLSWLAQLLEANKELVKMRPNPHVISGMSLLFNVSALCYQFCTPIISSGSKAVSLTFFFNNVMKKYLLITFM